MNAILKVHHIQCSKYKVVMESLKANNARIKLELVKGTYVNVILLL